MTETPTTSDEVAARRGGCKPGMRGCRRGSCGHRAIVEEYREARDAQQAQAENATYGYATELASFYEQNPRVTFRRWIENRAACRPELEEATAA